MDATEESLPGPRNGFVTRIKLAPVSHGRSAHSQREPKSISAMNANAVPDDGASSPVRLDELALARLQELDPDGRHGVVSRVLAAYDTSLQRMLAQLRGAQEPALASVMASVAHTLKSSSASVGALALARTCAEVEARLRNGDAAALAGDLARLIADGEAALGAVRAILHE